MSAFGLCFSETASVLLTALRSISFDLAGRAPWQPSDAIQSGGFASQILSYTTHAHECHGHECKGGA